MLLSTQLVFSPMSPGLGDRMPGHTIHISYNTYLNTNKSEFLFDIIDPKLAERTYLRW